MLLPFNVDTDGATLGGYREYRTPEGFDRKLDGGGDDGAPTPPPRPPIDLPEDESTAADSERRSMEEFINAPSQDKWLELVEAMRLVREVRKRGADDVAAAVRCPPPPRSSIERRHRCQREDGGGGNPRRSNRYRIQQSGETSDGFDEEELLRPDPPSYNSSVDAHESEDNDSEGNIMGGWTLCATETREYNEDEEVSDHLRHMLSHSMRRSDEESVAEASYSYVASRGHACMKRARQLSSACIFLMGFLFGMIVIVGLSFTFDRTPSEEILEMRLRARMRMPQGGGDDGSLTAKGTREKSFESVTSLDEGDAPAEQDEGDEDGDGIKKEATSEEEGVPEAAPETNPEEEPKEEEIPLSEFCAPCQYKHAPFNCEDRVKWEMETYNLSEEEAMRANMKHCTMPESSIIDHGDRL